MIPQPNLWSGAGQGLKRAISIKLDTPGSNMDYVDTNKGYLDSFGVSLWRWINKRRLRAERGMRRLRTTDNSRGLA